jgi:hypothetical protein
VGGTLDDLRRRAPLLMFLGLLIALALGVWLVDRSFD